MQTIIHSIQIRLLGRRCRPLNYQRRFWLLMGLSTLVATCTRSSQSEGVSSPSSAQAVRQIQHALGETEIPAHPSRVVVWGYTMVEAVLALGIQPMGVPGIIIDEMVHLSLDAGAITDIGEPGQPNLEKIAALNPDLILTTQQGVANNYPLFSQIAPTVVFDIDERVAWRELTRLCGDALGKQTEAETLSAAYEAKLQLIKDQIPQDLGQIEASIAVFFPGHIRTLGKETFPGSVLAAVGISRPPGQTQGQGLRNISLEALDKLDGDVMFMITPQSDTELAAGIRAEIDRIKANPLWSQLKAVQTNQIYEVNPHWSLGNYIAANLILDDLLRYLTLHTRLPTCARAEDCTQVRSHSPS